MRVHCYLEHSATSSKRAIDLVEESIGSRQDRAILCATCVIEKNPCTLHLGFPHRANTKLSRRLNYTDKPLVPSWILVTSLTHVEYWFNDDQLGLTRNQRTFQPPSAANTDPLLAT